MNGKEPERPQTSHRVARPKTSSSWKLFRSFATTGLWLSGARSVLISSSRFPATRWSGEALSTVSSSTTLGAGSTTMRPRQRAAFAPSNPAPAAILLGGRGFARPPLDIRLRKPVARHLGRTQSKTGRELKSTRRGEMNRTGKSGLCGCTVSLSVPRRADRNPR